MSPVGKALSVRALTGTRATEYAGLETRFHQAFEQRREAAHQMVAARRNGDVARTADTRADFVASQQRVADVRASAVSLVQEVSGDTAFTDVNYVFPTFITTRLPIGLAKADRMRACVRAARRQRPSVREGAWKAGGKRNGKLMGSE